jgi:hypothetical protein
MFRCRKFDTTTDLPHVGWFGPKILDWRGRITEPTALISLSNLQIVCVSFPLFSFAISRSGSRTVGPNGGNVKRVLGDIIGETLTLPLSFCQGQMGFRGSPCLEDSRVPLRKCPSIPIPTTLQPSLHAWVGMKLCGVITLVSPQAPSTLQLSGPLSLPSPHRSRPNTEWPPDHIGQANQSRLILHLSSLHPLPTSWLGTKGYPPLTSQGDPESRIQSLLHHSKST